MSVQAQTLWIDRSCIVFMDTLSAQIDVWSDNRNCPMCNCNLSSYSPVHATSNEKVKPLKIL